MSQRLMLQVGDLTFEEGLYLKNLRRRKNILRQALYDMQLNNIPNLNKYKLYKKQLDCVEKEFNDYKIKKLKEL